MTRHIRLRAAQARTLIAVLAVVATACRGETTLGVAAAISVVAGASQEASVGTSVATAPTVRVDDADGNPIRGVTVRFTIGLGGGTVLGDSVMTDANGRATVGEWILGTSPGTNTLTAKIPATLLTATVTATGVTGNGVSLRSSGQLGFIALVGQAVSPAPAVLVLDSFGNPVTGVTVRFTVVQGGGSVTGDSVVTGVNGIARVGAWILGGAPGVNRLTARISSGPTISFTAQGLTSAPVLTATSATNQAGFLAFPVTSVPRVRVTDATGHVLASVPVTFSIAGGDAVVSDGAAITDANGIAAPSDWRLGQGGSSTVIATAGLGATPVSFTATGVAAQFLIDMRFLTSMSPDVRDAFVAAALRWMRIITAHLTPITVNLPASSCAMLQPSMTETITDVVIFATVTPIDGPGNILGSAGPCAVRSITELPVVGSMEFDSADLPALVATNQLVATITHEMGHVLGFGTIWSNRNVTSGIGGSDPVFTGAEALAIWPPFATALNYAGQPVPLENTGGAGTRDVHWRENRTPTQTTVALFGAELMTGYIEAPGVPMPLSKVTIASMKDLGYQVDYSQADLFVGNLLASRTAAPAIRINEQVGRARWTVTPDGMTQRIR